MGLGYYAGAPSVSARFHPMQTEPDDYKFPFLLPFFFSSLFVACCLVFVCVCVFFWGGRWREAVPGNPQAQNIELKRSILLFLSTTLNSKSLNQHRFLAHILPCRSGFPPAYTSVRHGHLPSCSLP